MKVNPTRFALGEYARNVWTVDVPEGDTMETVTSRDYFAHVAKQLKPWDRIEVRAENGDWFAELLVRSAGPNWATTRVLAFHKLAADAPEAKDEETGYEVKYAGPQHKHRVIRKSDKQVVAENLPTKEDAHAWVKEHTAA